MDDKLIQVLSNPIASRLLLEIQNKGQTTAKCLAETFPDLPQATLYRYLNNMLKKEFIKIVAENKIRGTVERIYEIAVVLPETDQIALDQLTGENYFNMFTKYMMGLLHEFSEYTSQKNIDIQADRSGFSICPLYLTDAELEDMGAEIQSALVSRLANKPTAERKLRSIGVIITPPKKETII